MKSAIYAKMIDKPILFYLLVDGDAEKGDMPNRKLTVFNN